MTTKSLTHRTFDTMVGLRTGKLTPDTARAQLSELRVEAGDDDAWQRVKVAALASMSKGA